MSDNTYKLTVKVSYYHGSLPLLIYTGDVDQAPRMDVVWIDVSVGPYSHRLQGFDYYFIDEWKVGGWYTTSDTYGKGFCWEWFPDGSQIQREFVMPQAIEPFVGVQVPKPDSITVGLE